MILSDRCKLHYLARDIFQSKSDSLMETRGYEHIWLDDVTYDGSSFSGTIDDDPVYAKGIKKDDQVTVSEKDITDWMIVDQESKIQGGYTIIETRNRMSAQGRENFDKQSGLIFEDPNQ
jgi:uncharacterized protein YegJ (DUF2314 family)